MADKENNMKTNERPETRIPEFIELPEVRRYIKAYYEALDKAHYPDIALSRWRKGTHYPPTDVLVGIARVAGTNLSYILGLTNVNCPCDYDKEPKERTLKGLMEVRKISQRELALAMDRNYRSLHNFDQELPRKRIYSLIKLSNAIDLSADYILGYTDWEKWELYARVARPFKSIKAGSGAYVVADRNSRSISDIEAAIARGDGQHCLLTTDGKYVIFPNGNKVSVNDEMFTGVYVAKVKPEVT